MKTKTLVALAMAVALSGCGWVHSVHVDKAIEVCAPHSGLRWVRVSLANDNDVLAICMNGTEIEARAPSRNAGDQ